MLKPEHNWNIYQGTDFGAYFQNLRFHIVARVYVANLTKVSICIVVKFNKTNRVKERQTVQNPLGHTFFNKPCANYAYNRNDLKCNPIICFQGILSGIFPQKALNKVDKSFHCLLSISIKEWWHRNQCNTAWIHRNTKKTEMS